MNILTAEEAFKKATSIESGKNKENLDAIMARIIKAVEEGKTSLTLYKGDYRDRTETFLPATKVALNKLGYKVDISNSSYLSNVLAIISWDKSNETIPAYIDGGFREI